METKEKTKNIELIINLCKEISQNNEKNILLEKLDKLLNLGVIDEQRKEEWIARYDSKLRDDLDINQAVACSIVNKLFNIPENEKIDFLELNIQLGLSVFDTYCKKINGLQTCFYDKKSIRKKALIGRLSPEERKTDSENTPLSREINLMNQGYLHEYDVLPDYIKAEKYYKEALDLITKKEGGFKESELDIIKFLNEKIDIQRFKHETWLKKYEQMGKLLKKKFSIDQCLMPQEYSNTFGKFYSFLSDLLRNRNFARNNLVSGAYISALKNYCFDSIKQLKNKNMPQINEVISNLYVQGSMFDEDELKHLKTALDFDKTNFEAYYHIATYYERQGNIDEAIKNWDELVKCFFSKIDKKDFKLLRNYKSEVGMISDSYIFENLILKRSKKDLSNEYNLTKIIFDRVSDKEFTSEPVTFIKEPDGTFYLILRKSTGRTLSEVTEYLNQLEINKDLLGEIKDISKTEIINNFKVCYLKKVLDSLIALKDSTKNLELKLPRHDYATKLKTKLEKSGMVNHQEIYRNCSFLIEYLNNTPHEFGHCDFHLDNILEVENGFCILDYGNAALASSLFDTVYLLEQEKLNLNEYQKNELSSYFIKKSGAKIVNKEKSYYHHALYINLLGMSVFTDEKRIKYLNNAKGIIKRIEPYLDNKYLIQLKNLEKNIIDCTK